MKPTSDKRQLRRRRSFQKGLWSETLAAFALKLSGYRILDRRFRCKSGEIDIIAIKRDLVVFVEVKARATVSEAVDSVGYQNQIRIRNAADFWLSKQRDVSRLSFRFDVVAVVPMRWPKHFKDAF